MEKVVMMRSSLGLAMSLGSSWRLVKVAGIGLRMGGFCAWGASPCAGGCWLGGDCVDGCWVDGCCLGDCWARATRPATITAIARTAAATRVRVGCGFIVSPFVPGKDSTRAVSSFKFQKQD